MSKWATLQLKEIEAELKTDLHSGLSIEEANKRIETYGPNQLKEGERENVLSIFFRQFQSPLIYVLLVSAVIVFSLHQLIDGFLILATLFFNALIGCFQEGKAQNTLLALKNFTESSVTVIRDGKEIVLNDKEIVPGDVLMLLEGEKIAADARIIEANTLRVDESALTGESVPIHKEGTILKNENAELAEQHNMVFKGTSVVGGIGRAVVVSTGLDTEIGKISKEIAGVNTEIPLKRDIAFLSKVIIWLVFAISLIIFFLGLLQGRAVSEMFSTTVSLAISIIPEGLPIVLTLILAQGVWRMAKRHALVKKLQAVEALGQAKIIAVDKTGTLTKNEMVIKNVYVNGKIYDIGGNGYELKGDCELDGGPVVLNNHPELLLAGKIAAFSASGRVVYMEDPGIWRSVGDPTESSMYVFAMKSGFDKDELEKESPKIAEIPFDYKTQVHVVSHKVSGTEQFISVVGAPEKVIERSGWIYESGQVVAIDDNKKHDLQKIFHHLSKEGLRVVGFGYKEAPLSESQGLLDVTDAVFGGFYGIEDSLRPEVPLAVEKARQAGVKLVMITGDAKTTAIAIAKEAGIWHEWDNVLTDEDINKLGEAALDEQIGTTTVFARITPEHKMKIIEAYKRRGETIAMTGDGVNDAPSLVSANLGVAMGKIGTEVAREASDIILLDDNFGSIVSAIEEGRSMYKIIQKAILFLFSTSIGELLTIFGAMLLGWPLPLLAPQILWLNLVTDSFVALALALEDKDPELKDDFRHPNRYLIDRLMRLRMVTMSIPIAVGSLYIFGTFFRYDMGKAWTMCLAALAVFQWLNGWNCRSRKKSMFSGFFENKFLLAFVGLAAVLQVFVTYNPVTQRIFHFVALSWQDWLIVVLIASTIVWIEELRKALVRMFERKEPPVVPTSFREAKT